MTIFGQHLPRYRGNISFDSWLDFLIFCSFTKTDQVEILRFYRNDRIFFYEFVAEAKVFGHCKLFKFILSYNQIFIN